jgi:ATP-dependent Clp protease protease subunit
MAINIFGEIGFDVTAKEVFDLIQAEKEEEINVIISSGGGSAFEGLMIFDALKASGKKINTQIMGLGASAASVIFMAGDNREMGEGSLLMVHNSWSMFMGNAKEVREQLGTLDAIDSRMTSIFMKATGLDEAKVTELLKDETFMSSIEAVDLGFATGEVEAAKVAANIHKTYQTKQKEPAKMAKETKETGFFAHMKAYFNSDVKAMDEDEEVKSMEEGEEIPEKEDDAAEEAKAMDGDEMPPESMDEEEESEEMKALKAELAEANSKLAAAEAKAEGDSEDVEKEVEEKASLVFNAMTDDKVTMHEAKVLLSKPIADVKAALSDKESNASGRAKGQQPKADPKAGNKFEEYQAIEDPSKRKAFFALNKQAIINGNKESI